MSPKPETSQCGVEKAKIGVPRGLSRGDSTGSTLWNTDKRLATFMDVAVLRCLFIPHWDEEGVFWGLCFLHKRYIISQNSLVIYSSKDAQ